MQITRLSLPEFPALTEDELQSWLRIDAGQDEDTVAMLVGSATEYVEGVTGLCLGLSTYRVELDGIDESYRLPLAPVQSVSKVEYRDRDGVLREIDGWHLASGYLHFTGYPAGMPIVTLVAGYDSDVGIPQSLAHAIAVVVSAGYNGREEISDQTAKTVDRLCQRFKRIVW
ncbi:head-tail connector protein [Sphingomonas melonis]|jgi:uncharacterized phiE125 gp8 family phage protein|uniref:head-tail connector protein n=1 Tax=Sphingomonas melonis TaxID=152682 RepID=UPI00036F55A0|nr:hypothetical protein [Sphingomonas melonis]ATI54165.1 hypothetical protein CP552_00135 [Sphingomonas melonis]